MKAHLMRPWWRVDPGKLQQQAQGPQPQDLVLERGYGYLPAHPFSFEICQQLADFYSQNPAKQRERAVKGVVYMYHSSSEYSRNRSPAPQPTSWVNGMTASAINATATNACRAARSTGAEANGRRNSNRSSIHSSVQVANVLQPMTTGSGGSR